MGVAGRGRFSAAKQKKYFVMAFVNPLFEG